MTILASTPAHLVEFENGFMSIHRRSDERHLALKGKRIAGDFRDCLKTHPAERVIATFIRMAGPAVTWHAPIYKPGVLATLGQPETDHV